MTLTEFASLAGLRPRLGSPGWYDGKCPHREDKHPSFTAWENCGWIWFIDRGSSALTGKALSEAVVGALGINLTDLKTGSDTHTDFRYEAEDGRHFYKRRITHDPFSDDKAQRKTFVQFNGSTGRPDDSADLLYRDKDVRWAAYHHKPIVLCEGEKAVDAIRKAWHMVATCPPNGGGSFRESHAHKMKGASRIVVWSDNDPQGVKFANDRYRILKEVLGTDYEVDIVKSKSNGEKDDAFDHIAFGYSLSDAIPVVPDPHQDVIIDQSSTKLPQRANMGQIKAIPVACEVVTYGEEFDPVALCYTMEPYIVRSKCNLLDAHGGTGKTTFALALAAALSRGENPLTGSPRAYAKTLYFHSPEDTSDELETVARANGLVPGHLLQVEEPFWLDADGFEKLELTLDKYKPEVVIFDALIYFFPPKVDIIKQGDIRPILSRLNQIATKHNVSIINIRHFTKGSLILGRNGKPIPVESSTMGVGSYQFHASHRSQLILRKHPDREGSVVVTHAKANMLTQTGSPFEVIRDGLRLEFRELRSDPFAPPSPDETASMIKRLTTLTSKQEARTAFTQGNNHDKPNNYTQLVPGYDPYADE